MGSDESGGRRTSSPYRKYSPIRNGSTPNRSLDAWRSYDNPDGDKSGNPISKFEIDPEIPLEPMAAIRGASAGEMSESGDSDGQMTKGLIIGDELVQATNSGSAELDEMQRKKEKIMLQSLRRKQQQEENR